MRQATYTNNPLILIHSGQTVRTETAKPRAKLVRRIARAWDLIGVLALMGSSAAYGVYALTHLGLPR